MGPDKEDGVSPVRFSGQGCKASNRETASLGEGWAVVLLVPGGGDEGGGDGADPDVDPSEAEHDRAIYCDAANSGPLGGGGETAGDTGTKDMVGADKDRLEGGQVKGGSKGRRQSGGGGGAGVDGLGIRSRSRHTGGYRRRHRGGGVPGSKRLQWSRVERSGEGRRINSLGGPKSMTK